MAGRRIYGGLYNSQKGWSTRNPYRESHTRWIFLKYLKISIFFKCTGGFRNLYNIFYFFNISLSAVMWKILTETFVINLSPLFMTFFNVHFSLDRKLVKLYTCHRRLSVGVFTLKIIVLRSLKNVIERIMQSLL